MGRSFDTHDELDRPDLNKCPDCGCFFAQDSCPLCGKVCPEEMRAGNRKPPKKVKQASVSDRVTFVQWYHSWWFIVIMMFIFPIAGIALLVTSPHKKWQKIDGFFVFKIKTYTYLKNMSFFVIIKKQGEANEF